MSLDLKDMLNEADNTPFTPGRMVKALRKAQGLKLKQIEEITGISITNLSAIENDRDDLGVKRASILAAALGAHPKEILFPNGDWNKDDYSSIIKKAQELIEAS